jgi:hypothetical protein
MFRFIILTCLLIAVLIFYPGTASAQCGSQRAGLFRQSSRTVHRESVRQISIHGILCRVLPRFCK